MNAPEIVAKEDEQGNLSFYCQYCHKTHFHGRGFGHRVAHCRIENKSPYKQTGYYLVPEVKKK